MKFLKLLVFFFGSCLISSAYSSQNFDKIIVGDFEPDWKDIEAIDNPEIQEQARAVGRLIIPAKKNAGCTNFLISDDVIMTNQHCISSQEDAVGAFVYFNYQKEGQHQAFICDEFISNNKKLDFALFKM